jgi:hypothetical protein
VPISAKPAEITHRARTPCACRGVEDLVGRKADHGQIDLSGDLVDRVVGANAGDRLAFEVDGVGGAREVGVEDVAEELAPDRPAAS